MNLKAFKKKFKDIVKKTSTKEELLAAIEKLKKDEDDSLTEATFESKEKHYSVFKDPSIPFYRRWYMFAFVYPSIISITLGLVGRNWG